MAHPKHGYYLKNGKRVIGTTTAIGRFKESGALMWWACEQGKAIQRGEISNMYEKRDQAAEIGTSTHWLVERHINGELPIDLSEAKVLEIEGDIITLTDDHRQKMQSGFDAYLAWERMTQLKITHQELQLVSTRYKFGGCPDAIGLIDGQHCLLDWKTSKGVYADFLIQIAAYGYLCQYGVMPEHGYKRLGIKVEGFHLCKFSKEHGDFSHHYYPELDVGWEQMKLFLKAYQNDKVLKSRAK